MATSTSVTRKDIDDVLNVLNVMMTRIDERFTKVESTLVETQKRVQDILNQLDHINKRLVMAHQLTQLHEWVEKAAARIDVKFAH
jgi:archaellum component FlaC